MLPAAGGQHARRQVQEHGGGRVDDGLGDLPGAAQRALSFVELAHPDRPEGNRPKRGREDRVTDGPINLEQRGMLLTASVRAQMGAATHLPDYDRASLNAGMWAIAYQITMWAESLDTTSRRKPDDVLDFHDSARIFQNELENIVLREKNAERALSRLALNLPSHVPVYSV